jgi:hypothetical protein
MQKRRGSKALPSAATKLRETSMADAINSRPITPKGFNKIARVGAKRKPLGPSEKKVACWRGAR